MIPPLNTIKKSHKFVQLNNRKIGKREFSTSTTSKPHTARAQYNQLGSYLAGLIEGDGNLYTPGPNVKGYPQI